MGDEHWEREARLDRQFEQEPGPRTRQRIPLNERGALKQHFAPTCAGCGERVGSRDELSDDGICSRCFIRVMGQPVEVAS